MNVLDMCNLVELPKEVTKQVVAVESKVDALAVEQEIKDLVIKEKCKEARESLAQKLTDDTDGMMMLCCMMKAAIDSKQIYDKKKISLKVFIDTMKCFQRFVLEHKDSYNYYGFDRSWWTYRQLSLQLFRIGELEYEFQTLNGEKAISIHIPSDAHLTAFTCNQSYHMAIEFMKYYAPEYMHRKFFCYSWLLAPNLNKLLKQDSNILMFQSGFDLVKVDEDATEYLIWVYKQKDMPYEDLPENTSLQKNMKTFLLNGGKIGEALGILKNNPWDVA